MKTRRRSCGPRRRGMIGPCLPAARAGPSPRSSPRSISRVDASATSCAAHRGRGRCASSSTRRGALWSRSPGRTDEAGRARAADLGVPRRARGVAAPPSRPAGSRARRTRRTRRVARRGHVPLPGRTPSAAHRDGHGIASLGGHAGRWRSRGPAHVRLAPADRRPVGDVLEAWLRARARNAVRRAIDRHAQALNVAPAAISIRDQRTRWGSASRGRRLAFSWRLVLGPPEALDTVVVHELAHLRVFGHGRPFWTLVASRRPDHAQWRRWLREHALELHGALGQDEEVAEASA